MTFKLASLRPVLDDLAQRFAALTLSKPEWTHAAHLAIGLWHATRYGRDDALARLRSGIRRLNESHGVANTTTGGYHETVTRAYVELLAAFTQHHAALTPAAQAEKLLSCPLAARSALLKFYSRERGAAVMPHPQTLAARALPALLALYCAASFVHFWHNAEFLMESPNLPGWLTRVQVYAVRLGPLGNDERRDLVGGRSRSVGPGRRRGATRRTVSAFVSPSTSASAV